MLSIALAAALALSEPTVSAADLAGDAKILREALTTLHPGLNRYLTPNELEAAFTQFEQAWSKEQSLREAYVSLSTFLSKIKCGHTHVNPYNLDANIRSHLWPEQGGLPFTFRWIDNVMVVTMDLTPENSLPRGTIIRQVNGVSTAEIKRAFLPLTRADGSNFPKRQSLLELTGTKYELLDSLLPTLTAAEDGLFTLSADTDGSGGFKTVGVPALSASRESVVQSRTSEPAEAWRFEMLGDDTGYLKLGTFVTWSMTIDWKKMLADSFAELKTAKAKALIIDIRGNEGGDDSVQMELAPYILSKPLSLPEMNQRTAYRTVPETLRPYLNTWDEGFYDRQDVEPLEGGGFGPKDAPDGPTTFGPYEGAFPGKIYLLVGPDNSSSTFYLAWRLQDSGIATLIGEPTGGSKRGLNGGQFIFLKLPGSGLEVDIPLIAALPVKPQPDSGVIPDIVVRPTRKGIAAGRDVVLYRALKEAQD